MILGEKSDPSGKQVLDKEMQGVDAVLSALYDTDRRGNLGSSSPNINRWLGDIRKYFPTPVVQIMQKDALDRIGLTQMLLEPELLETVEADVQLAATILQLNKIMPERTKATAQMVVRRVVKELDKKLRVLTQQAVQGALNKAVRNRHPRFREIDWHRTIRANLRHYQPDFQTIIPEHLIGFGKKGHALKHIILLIDQSGSMATSVVYAALFGSILASLRSVKTSLIVFDTAVVDLSDKLHDPVELLFGTQLGGGTDINRALAYAETSITAPADTILFLVTDLFEGGNADDLLRRAASIRASGVQLITLLALNDEGAPSFDRQVASKFAALDVPCFACTADRFPDLIAAAIKKEDLTRWNERG